MDVLFLLIPVSLLLAGSALIAFIWSVRSGQLDDLVGPSEKLIKEDLENINLGGMEKNGN